MLRYVYGILFHLIYSNTVSCLATNQWRNLCATARVYSRERLTWQLWAYMLSTSEVNFIVGYITTAQLFVLSFSFFYFLVRVRCSRKESSRSLSHLLMSFLYCILY